MSSELDLTLPDVIGSTEDLPSPPGVVVEVLRLSKDDDAGVDDFARVISGDPALAARLIKLSNSSMFAAGSEVTSLERACVLLGLKTVQLMALSFSLTEASPDSKVDIGFSLKEYWARSLITAVAGRNFSKHSNLRLNDEAFLCGLLSQIGQLAILHSIPDAYREVIDISKGEWPTRETETELMGFDRSIVGAALLQTWGLPDPICLSIAYASRPDSIPEDVDDRVKKLVGILHVAECTADVLRCDAKGEALGVLRDAAESAGMEAAALDEWLDGLDADITETAELLDVDLAPGATHAEILDEARQQVMRISLGAAADLHQAERRAHNLENENKELAEKASKDELTGILNRAGFDEVMAAEMKAQIAGKRPNCLGLLMLDADHFKQFNDTHGHRAGDEVLRTIGRLLTDITRDSDSPARYGGEEFAVIAPATTLEGLELVAERLRASIEAEVIDFEGTQLQVTVSVGGACLLKAAGPEDVAKLVEAADQRLYDAKHNGRNCFVICEEILDFT